MVATRPITRPHLPARRRTLTLARHCNYPRRTPAQPFGPRGVGMPGETKPMPPSGIDPMQPLAGPRTQVRDALCPRIATLDRQRLVERVMRIAIVLAFGAFAECSVQAQVRSAARDHSQYGIGDPHQGPSARWRSNGDSSAVRCLVRKSNGRRVCHSLKHWREIARQMDWEQGRER